MSLVSRDTMTVLRSMEGCPGIPGYYVLRDWGVYMASDVLGIPGYYVLRDWGIYMGGGTWDVLGIPGYYVLRNGGGLCGEKYLGRYSRSVYVGVCARHVPYV